MANKIFLSKLNKLITNENLSLFIGVRNIPEYGTDNKPTGKMSAVRIEALADGLESIMFVFPYADGLAKKIEERFVFATPFSLQDLEEYGTFYDVSISVYNNAPYIKILMR